MTALSAAAQEAELDEVIDEQRSLTGTSPCVFRPPYGDYDTTTLALARHLAVWMWDVDTEDWQAEGSSASYWVDRIVSLAESEGGVLDHPVVLMHNQAIPMPATVAALPTIIRYFESHGYTFVNLLGRAGPPMACGPETGTAVSALVRSGTRLEPETVVKTSDGQFRLVMQADGNLVLAAAAGPPLWSSATVGSPGAFAVMQTDGNLTVRSFSGEVLWSSATAGHPGARLEVDDDGSLAVVGPKGDLWCSGSRESELVSRGVLSPGWVLESPIWLSRLVMQSDGNLVLYSIGGRVLWQSRTAGNPGASAVMQHDGDLVVRATSGRVLWTSGTGTDAGAELTFSVSGGIAVTTPSGTVPWTSA